MGWDGAPNLVYNLVKRLRSGVGAGKEVYKGFVKITRSINYTYRPYIPPSPVLAVYTRLDYGLRATFAR